MAHRWLRLLQGRFGNGAGGIVLLAIPLISFFNGTIISMGTNARMLWAFSRDRGPSWDASSCRMPLRHPFPLKNMQSI